MDDSTAFCPVCGVYLEKADARKCKVCDADIAAVRAGQLAEEAGGAETPFAPSAVEGEDVGALPENPPPHPKLGETVRGSVNIGDTAAGTLVLNWQRKGWVLDSNATVGDSKWDMSFRFDPEEAAARIQRAKRIGLAVAFVVLLAIAGIAFAIYLGSA